MIGATPSSLRLRGRRPGLIRLLVLPPLAIAALGPGFGIAVGRPLRPETLVFSGWMLAIAGLGLVHELTRQTLVADHTGVRLSRGLRRLLIHWTEIEDIVVVGPLNVAGAAPLDALDIRLRVIGQTAAKLGGRNRPPRHDVVVPNDFGAPSEAVVAELRRRWRRSAPASTREDSMLGGLADAGENPCAPAATAQRIRCGLSRSGVALKRGPALEPLRAIRSSVRFLRWLRRSDFGLQQSASLNTPRCHFERGLMTAAEAAAVEHNAS